MQLIMTCLDNLAQRPCRADQVEVLIVVIAVFGDQLVARLIRDARGDALDKRTQVRCQQTVREVRPDRIESDRAGHEVACLQEHVVMDHALERQAYTAREDACAHGEMARKLVGWEREGAAC